MERRAVLVALATLLGGCFSESGKTRGDRSPSELDFGSNVFLFPSSLREAVRNAVDAPGESDQHSGCIP